MSAHEILIAVMAAFAILGGLDRVFGNRFGLGQEFENGILAMGSLALAMVGIITLSPVLAQVLTPVAGPIYSFLGADPAMIITGEKPRLRRLWASAKPSPPLFPLPTSTAARQGFAIREI